MSGLGPEHTGNETIAALEKILGLELPENCEVEVRIRDFTAAEGKSRAIKVNLVREKSAAIRFEVERILGAVSEAHRT